MILLVIVALVGAFAFALLMKLYWARNTPSKPTSIVTGAVVALLAALAILAASGRLHWLAAVATGALPFLRHALRLALNPVGGLLLRRFLAGRGGPSPLGGMFGGFRQSPPEANGDPRQSSVQTGDLRMTLNHETGEMDGEVLRGARQGKRLGELDLAQVVTLLTEFDDERSRQLLSAYLDRRAPGWNDAAQGNQDVQQDTMTVERALKVLDLPDSAGRDDVVAAHRRLMQRLHPDRGGSAFLAATLNEAKKVLLDRL